MRDCLLEHHHIMAWSRVLWSASDLKHGSSALWIGNGSSGNWMLLSFGHRGLWSTDDRAWMLWYFDAREHELYNFNIVLGMGALVIGRSQV